MGALTGRTGAIVASYAALGAVLVLSRLANLDHSLWHDEIVTLVDYVRGGLAAILLGAYIPNNHELFSALAWATAELTGDDSEVALRLWSVIPFIAGVALVTVWLHIRVGVLTAVLYAWFTTLSPMLLDLSRQARGYGLAFLAMSVLIVAALEARRTGPSWAILAFLAGGVAGTLTLPIFGIGFLATAAVLLLTPTVRRRLALGLAASVVAIVAWYAPHVDDLLASSGQEFGAPIPWWGIVTAPVDQLFLPSLVVEGVAPSSLVWLPISAVIGYVLLSSRLIRAGRPWMVLIAGMVATLLVVWVARLYLVPRFVSYLLVPLSILLASGTAHILARPLALRSVVAKLVALTLLAVVAMQFASLGVDMVRLPREANKDAARLIDRDALPDAAVLTYLHHPVNLAVYLDRPVAALDASEVVTRVCSRRGPTVYVTQPIFIEPVEVPCLARPGTRHIRLEQYARGGFIDVWLVPPPS